MLVHLRPRFYCVQPWHVELVDVRLEPLGLILRNGVDVAAGRPYPNKGYLVAHRKLGRLAADGLLIDCKDMPSTIECVARWSIEASYIASHRVTYQILDDEFDAVTDDMTLWARWLGRTSPAWNTRMPSWAKGLSPVEAEPVMEIESTRGTRLNTRDYTCLDEHGNPVLERHQQYAMPTVERFRLAPSKYRSKMPLLSTAFSA